MWMCAVIGIHIPPYKKYISDTRNPYGEVIYLYTYGRQKAVVGRGRLFTYYLT